MKLAQLLTLNQEVAAKIGKGSVVTAPGVPKDYPNAQALGTEDCIEPHLLVGEQNMSTRAPLGHGRL